MGEVRVPGLGIVQLRGDQPDDDEVQAILAALEALGETDAATQAEPLTFPSKNREMDAE